MKRFVFAVAVAAVTLAALVAWCTAVLAVADAATAGMGYNGRCLLGTGHLTTAVTRPTPTLPLGAVKTLATGDSTSLALLTDGSLLAWGGTRHDCTPKVVLHGVVQADTHGTHSIALLKDGTVRVSGADLFGEFGNGTTTHGRECCGWITSKWLPVPGLSHVTAVYAVGADDWAVTASGQVYGWGENSSGQITSSRREQDRPVLVHGVAGPSQISGGGIGSHGGYTLFLEHGTVLAQGLNAQGQLGRGLGARTGTLGAVSVAGVVELAGNYGHALARLQDGLVAGWGSDNSGELGRVATVPCERVVCVPTPAFVPGVSGVSQVCAGLDFSFFLAGGQAFGEGLNTWGALGDGTRTDKAVPTPLGLSGVSGVACGQHQTLLSLG